MPGRKIYYPIEEQINDCYKYLGVNRKDAHEMNEAELTEAELELRNDFVWVEHPDYMQAVPMNIKTGILIA